MDLGDLFDGATSSTLLEALASEEQARHASEVRTWAGIVAWAERNLWNHESGEKPVEDVVAALDTGAQLAGDGTPMVSEFAVMELIAVLGRSPDGGRLYVAKILECAWRLHRVYTSVTAGRLAPWHAARIAELTLHLSAEAAAYVDSQLFNATKVGWAQLERLIAEAVIRFDPETAEKERLTAQNNLHVHVSTPTETGQVYVDATLDAADGADLNTALARGAEARQKLGDDSSLDERRARALGDMSRRDLALDLLIADTDTGEIIATAPGRVVETVVHITPGSLDGENPVGSLERPPRRDHPDPRVAAVRVEDHRPPGHRLGELRPRGCLRDPRSHQGTGDLARPPLQVP